MHLYNILKKNFFHSIESRQTFTLQLLSIYCLALCFRIWYTGNLLVSLKCRFSFVHTLLLSWPKLWFRKLIGWFDLHCCLNFRCKRSGPCLAQPCEFGSNHTRETVDIAEQPFLSHLTGMYFCLMPLKEFEEMIQNFGNHC